MSYNLPNPSLLGILLIISTHSGPQLVFQYPNDLSVDALESSVSVSTTNLTPDEDEDEDEIDEEHVGTDSPGGVTNDSNNANGYSHSRSPSPSEEIINSTKYKSNEWDSHHLNFYMGTKKDLLLFLDEQEMTRKQFQSEKSHTNKAQEEEASLLNKPKAPSKSVNTIFGIESSYLAEMLSPPRKMCNSRFEIMIDNKIFLGLPVHKYDNGNWRIKRGKKEQTDRGSTTKSSHDKVEKKHSTVRTEEGVADGISDNGITNSSTTTIQANTTSINMFHLVFIMNPPVIESNYRIDEMFHYVISRLALVLRYEQLKNEFISSQIKDIFNLKEQFKEPEGGLSQYLVNKSPLCKTISDCYNSISQSKIANLSINNKLRSFQIPIKTEFHTLPEISVPYIPGSYLSSTVNLLESSGLISVGETTRYSQSGHLDANFLSNVEEDASSSSDDVIYFALLLLDDPESIVRDIRTEQDSTLAKFIRMIKPTESLLKLSLRNINLDRLQIKSFAFHLIYWRRARVIQPLSTRSTYIISPMAPITINFFQDIRRFRMAHPSLPSLPSFLKLLSSKSRKPQQFASNIPSKDHRDIYLEALSWLIRFGYATQLQTFIWLKISRKIKIKVEEDFENESLTKKRSSVSKKVAVGGTDNTSKALEERRIDVSNRGTKNVDQEIDKMKEVWKAANSGHNVTVEDDDDTIILDPGRASTLERRWINKIIFDECHLSTELTAIFYKLLKYMNGKSPLELLLLKENVSRTDLRKLLFAIEEHIISVRHW